MSKPYSILAAALIASGRSESTRSLGANLAIAPASSPSSGGWLSRTPPAFMHAPASHRESHVVSTPPASIEHGEERYSPTL